MRKIKKLLLTLASLFIALMSNVYAMVELGPLPVAMYGVEKPITFIDRVFSFLKFIAIPFILILGIIIFVIHKKRKNKDNTNSNEK